MMKTTMKIITKFTINIYFSVQIILYQFKLFKRKLCKEYLIYNNQLFSNLV